MKTRQPSAHWALAIAAGLLVGCGTTALQNGGNAPQGPRTAYRVLVEEDPGPLHSAQRRSYCIRYQCAFTSESYKADCVKACTDSWALARPHPVVVRPKPSVKPSVKPVVKPSVMPSVKPSVEPTTQELYHFDSNHSGTGVLGIVHLPLGKRTFRATHTGRSNFILYLNVPDGGPEVAFDEIGPGHWTWTYQVQKAGDYSLDLKYADGEWTLDIE
jgi:hypothetical protein